MASDEHTERTTHWIPVSGLTIIVFAAIFCFVNAAAAAGHGYHQESSWYFMIGVGITVIGGGSMALIIKVWFDD